MADGGKNGKRANVVAGRANNGKRVFFAVSAT